MNLYDLSQQNKRKKPQLIKESQLAEFAPAGDGDGGDDGFSDDTLKLLAAQWYNGNEDPRIEQTLMAAGWEIGQDEGYEDEPGVFVVRAGDVHGDSYMSWPADELRGVAEARRANTASARAEFSNRPRKPGLSPAEQDKAKSDSDAAWERLMAYADEQKKKEPSVAEGSANGMRLLAKYEEGQRAVKVYKNVEWNEYVVQFYEGGHRNPEADYHTDDKQDAIDSAASYLKKGTQGVTEAIHIDVDLVKAVFYVAKEIYDGAKAGSDMTDTIVDELGDYFDDVEQSGLPKLKKAYDAMRDTVDADPSIQKRAAGDALLTLNTLIRQGTDRLKRQGMAEGSENIGNTIRQLYQQIYDQGDDALEYLNTSAPLFSQYWDQYEGDLDSIIAEVSPKNLIRIEQELKQVAGHEGMTEGAKSHSELARLAHEAYIAAVRSGNSLMADHYKKAYEKHKRLAASERKSVAKGMAEDAEPFDRERQLVKKLGQLGSMIVQNPMLWEKYSDSIDNDNIEWIIGLIQDRTGASKEEVMHLAKLFGEIGGGGGRLVDFAWAVKEGTWIDDFVKPYIEYKKKNLREFAVNEAVGGNYLYHSTQDAATAKAILQSGVFKGGKQAAQAPTDAQTKLPTVSFGRSLEYQLSGADVGRNYQVVFVIDRNALESRYKTLGTSQSKNTRGLANAKRNDFNQTQLKYLSQFDANKDNQLSKDELDAWQQQTGGISAPGNKLKTAPNDVADIYQELTHSYKTGKQGKEFEEVVPTQTGTIPWQGMLVGFYLVPGKAAAKDPELLNHPLRLEMPTPNNFVRANGSAPAEKPVLSPAEKQKQRQAGQEKSRQMAIDKAKATAPETAPAESVVKEFAPAGGGNSGDDMPMVILNYIHTHYPDIFKEFGQSTVEEVVYDLEAMGYYRPEEIKNKDLEDLVSQVEDALMKYNSDDLTESRLGKLLNEFLNGNGDGRDDGGEDPYKHPQPEHYSRSIDFFGRFEADHFDREDFDDATGVFKGYWDDDQIAYFKFDNPKRAGSDDPGMGWYYEPQNESMGKSNTPVKHRIGLTVTDPNHPMVSKRGETIQKTVRVPGEDPAKAINAAIAHYRRKGYKVHDHHYMGTVDEGITEVSLGDYYRKANMAKAVAQMGAGFARSPEEREKNLAIAAKRQQGLDRAKVRTDKFWADKAAKDAADHLEQTKTKYAGVDIDAEIAKLKPAIQRAYHEYQYGARNTYSQGKADYDRLMGQVRELQQAKELLGQHGMSEELSELSNELLGRYKKELGVRASAADRAGDYDKGHEYFKKITKATLRQGENDARRHAQREKENEMMETRLNMMRKAGYDL